jgi:anti-sigma-K factor RskA
MAAKLNKRRRERDIAFQIANFGYPIRALAQNRRLQVKQRFAPQPDFMRLVRRWYQRNAPMRQQ